MTRVLKDSRQHGWPMKNSYFESFFWHGATKKKEAQKDHSIQEICLERTYSLKMSVNSRLKATKIVGQRKHSIGR